MNKEDFGTLEKEYIPNIAQVSYCFPLVVVSNDQCESTFDFFSITYMLSEKTTLCWLPRFMSKHGVPRPTNCGRRKIMEKEKTSHPLITSQVSGCSMNG